ncbi:hypothetical protein [Kordiimonas marina]|uniref:hypothetical protein n=1 Tax=Kordiimonas marina TaxID=2872312 RepID=UPI001FF2D9F4|nr:hypothetical protein [Kordiimonas marina]MCJ9430566.1 hypothetical protein [Kordiimonas marina]
MAQQFDLSNRFDILTDHLDDAVERILAPFTDRAVTPEAVRTHSHADGTLLVTVIVNRLAEAEARAIQLGLKHEPFIHEARLEHYIA